MNESEKSASLLARFAVLHAAALLLWLSWRFGGMEPLTRMIAAGLCLPAPIITVLALLAAPADLRRAAWRVLIPLAGLTVLVGLSLLNPSRQWYQFWDTPVLRKAAHHAWLPSTPLPSATLGDFLFNAGLVLTGLNLMFCRPSRAWLRGLLWLLALNGLTLAVLGTVFHLAGADQILGVVPSPNPNFFATFVYHNHWGGFALLSAAAALALALHAERRAGSRPLTQTTVPLLALVGAIILASIPLSSARASTLAAAALAAGVAVPGGLRLWRRLRHSEGAELPRRIGLLATAVIVLGFGLVISRDSWSRELAQTRGQIADLQTGGAGDTRLIIYRDTWRLVQAKPVFGWGWQSFQYVYPEVQSPLPRMQNRISRYAVVDAHNDWLQVLAEIGIAGCLLLALALRGALRWGRGRRSSPPQSVLLIGLGALGLLALVDFPLACPAIVLTTAIALAAGMENARSTSADLPAESRSRMN